MRRVVTDERRRDRPVEVGRYTITPVCRVQVTGIGAGRHVMAKGWKTPSELVVKLGDAEWTILVPYTPEG